MFGRRAVSIPCSGKPVGDPKIETQRSEFKNVPTPIAWTVAGSDPGGGAGIQADLKVMNAFGVHGCSVITALTAQNTLGVRAAEAVSPTLVQAQLDTLEADLPPAALKTGMLGSAAVCGILAAFLQSGRLSAFPVICDPVLRSTSGADLLDPGALDILRRAIIPHAAVLTPNLPEAGILTGRPVTSIEAAAERLLDLGAASVLIKGGHADGDQCSDYWTDGTRTLRLTSPRIDSRATHGTGCILSSAIASGMALGRSVPDAVIDAKSFLNQCLRSPCGLGGGHGPMHIRRFEQRPEDRPILQ